MTEKTIPIQLCLNDMLNVTVQLLVCSSRVHSALMGTWIVKMAWLETILSKELGCQNCHGSSDYLIIVHPHRCQVTMSITCGESI